MTISIPDACKLLGISRATLYRRLKAGELQCTRTAPNGVGHQSVTFSPAQLGMTAEQARLGSQDVQVNPNYEEPCTNFVQRPAPSADLAERGANFAPRDLSTIERRQLDDLEFAEQYKAGNAVDSCGNSISGNRKWPTKGVQTIIGPVEPRPRHKPSPFAHMEPALLGDAGVPPNPVSSDAVNELWHPGHLKRKAEMYADAGLKEPSQQEQKQIVDRAVIAAAFRQGYSR